MSDLATEYMFGRILSSQTLARKPFTERKSEIHRMHVVEIGTVTSIE